MGPIILASLLSLLIVLPFLLWGEDAETWVEQFLSDAPSLWLLAAVIFLLLAADIVLPIPSSVVATASGAFFGIGLGALVSAGGTCCPHAAPLSGWKTMPGSSAISGPMAF